VRKKAALAAVVLVVLEVVAAVLVNLATGVGASWWLWVALAGLVVVTCLLVWWRERQVAGRNSANVAMRARRKGAIEDSPVKISAPVETSVRLEADREGRITGSGVTITDSRPDQSDDEA
jgi:hypothetical protein